MTTKDEDPLLTKGSVGRSEEQNRNEVMCPVTVLPGWILQGVCVAFKNIEGRAKVLQERQTYRYRSGVGGCPFKME